MYKGVAKTHNAMFRQLSVHKALVCPEVQICKVLHKAKLGYSFEPIEERSRQGDIHILRPARSARLVFLQTGRGAVYTHDTGSDLFNFKILGTRACCGDHVTTREPGLFLAVSRELLARVLHTTLIDVDTSGMPTLFISTLSRSSSQLQSETWAPAGCTPRLPLARSRAVRVVPQPGRLESTRNTTTLEQEPPPPS